MHIPIWAPNTVQSSEKKTNTPIPRKLPEGLTGGWDDEP